MFFVLINFPLKFTITFFYEIHEKEFYETFDSKISSNFNLFYYGICIRKYHKLFF